ncbi:uncharacterized protein LOC6578643 [Drosophila mojavensis]|uniref:Uncharacterized protein n=1 Tax=Drosophila mojavensis TaxID=7230 RepID=B4KSY9_DROMO|nr:uncharacterized protein LOC6578643 [Drosophila mojavensis]EDW08486.1 uncharacterized protein Dmoj_GI19994 [Drosophila mojavensis]
MEQIWRNICAHYDVPEDVTNAWFARIEQHLSEDSPTRAYHNWQEMMQRKHEHLSDCAPSIALAAFFQYYHFDGNRSCVQQNCEVFEEFCRDAMIEDEQAKSLVCNLLGRKTPDNEVTWSHDEEANLLQDVDLVVLAAPPDEYKHYTQLLRHEYANLDDESYKMMRVKVLETLLLIPSIYATAEYHEKYEELARANIQNEIRELKQK